MLSQPLNFSQGSCNALLDGKMGTYHCRPNKVHRNQLIYRRMNVYLISSLDLLESSWIQGTGRLDVSSSQGVLFGAFCKIVICIMHNVDITTLLWCFITIEPQTTKGGWDIRYYTFH